MATDALTAALQDLCREHNLRRIDLGTQLTIADEDDEYAAMCTIWPNAGGCVTSYGADMDKAIERALLHPSISRNS